jgi:hypothetical protein
METEYKITKVRYILFVVIHLLDIWYFDSENVFFYFLRTKLVGKLRNREKTAFCTYLNYFEFSSEELILIKFENLSKISKMLIIIKNLNILQKSYHSLTIIIFFKYLLNFNILEKSSYSSKSQEKIFWKFFQNLHILQKSWKTFRFFENLAKFSYSSKSRPILTPRFDQTLKFLVAGQIGELWWLILWTVPLTFVAELEKNITLLFIKRKITSGYTTHFFFFVTSNKIIWYM